MNQSPVLVGDQLSSMRTKGNVRSQTWRQLTEDERSVVEAACQRRELEPNEVLMREGEPAEYLAIVEAGSLEVYVGAGEDRVSLMRVDPEGVLGVLEYYEDRVRSVSVRALAPSVVLVLPYEGLRHLLGEISALGDILIAHSLRGFNREFINNARRRSLVERSLSHLKDFLDLSSAYRREEGSEGLIERVVSMASKVMKADRATLFLVDQQSGQLWSKVAEGLGGGTIVVEKGKGIAGWVFQHGRFVHVPDVSADSRFESSVDEKTGYQTRNLLCGPVLGMDGRTIGVIQVINKLEGGFDEQDMELFRAFAHQAAVAVDNYFLFERLRRSNETLGIMLDVLDAATRSSDLTELIGTIVDKTTGIMQCERATFFVYNATAHELWSLKATGEGVERITFPDHLGIAGASVREKCVHMTNDAYQDARFNPEIDRITGYQTKSLLSAPVLDRRGNVHGVLQAINKSGGFEEGDVALIKAITSQLAEALKKGQILDDLQRHQILLQEANTRLERRVEERTKDLFQAYKELQRSNLDLHRNILELKRANESQQEILGTVAHELRNPIGAIINLSSVLDEAFNVSQEGFETDLEPDVFKDFLKEINGSAETALRLLESMIDTSRLEARAEELQLELHDLVALAREVIRANRPAADKKEIVIELMASGDCQWRVDALRFRQIVDNLLSNAVKYSNSRSRVVVNICEQSMPVAAVLEVTDHGPGFTAEDLSQIYGKFKRLSARPTAGETSTGLGLYIVKRLVELHGGTIDLRTEEGRGSTFTVTIPPLSEFDEMLA